MSAFEPDSEISRINRDAYKKPVKVSKETYFVIKKSIHYSKLCFMAMDITIKPIIDLWRLCDKTTAPPDDEIIKETLHNSEGWNS